MVSAEKKKLYGKWQGRKRSKGMDRWLKGKRERLPAIDSFDDAITQNH